MTDNLFDRLADLFKTSGPVNWRLAREIAESSAGQAEPIEPWLVEEYRELVAMAINRVDALTPLDPALAGAEIRVVDRREWASTHPEALQHLAEPLAEKLKAGADLPEMLRPLGPALVGLQIGGLVGAMSQRVLGDFDVGLPLVGTVPTLVAPNIEAFAVDHGLDARQVRLWVAIHEVVNAAAHSIPWLREQAVMALDRFVESLTVEADDLEAGVNAMQDPESLEALLAGGASFGGLVPDDDGLAALDDLRALLGMVEGYGDHLLTTMEPHLVPEAAAIREALDRSRSDGSPDEQMLEQTIGLDLDHAGYRLGGVFCAEVHRRWGAEAVARIWEAPESLPRGGELEDPVGWAARVLL